MARFDEESQHHESDAIEPSSEARVRKLRFDIGRLTLPGYSAAESARFAAALRLELERVSKERVRSGQTQAITSAIPHLDGGQLRHGASPEQAAAQVAGRVGSAMGGSRGGPTRG
jgi:hypothetical protein